jgi:hypothetical protein
MNKNYCPLLLLFPIMVSCAKQPHEILVEAESFSDKGGWVVDPQFVEQMGSPYLLAHGMGTPVRNAQTSISLSSIGKYFVWVRTKNWAAGEWEAPGRFHILINGGETTQAAEERWTWQYAGKTSMDTAVFIELKDLTDLKAGAMQFISTTINNLNH